MTDATPTRRAEVLVAFHAACPRPNAEDVAVWVERYPTFADDIRTHAEALLASIQDRDLRPEPSERLLARTRSVALGALATARARAAGAKPSVDDLRTLIAAAGTDVPRLARALGLGRAPLVDLAQGRVRLPVAVPILETIASALRTTAATVDAALCAAAASPAMGLAKAEGMPTAPSRAFADIIQDDPTMSPEQKVRWLSLARGVT